MIHFYLPFRSYLVFIGCWVATGLVAGLYLLREQAPYGRYSSKDWGPMISNKWGWLLMEATVLFSFSCWLPWRRYHGFTPGLCMVLLFLLHYIHRSFIYPFRIRTKGKKMPVLIMLSAMLFNTINGSLLGIWFNAFARYNDDWFRSPAFIGGLVLYLGGMGINWWTDRQLIRLRKKGETGYSIPQGGLFTWLSSPNLAGEILEWGGYALLTWSWPALAFFIWTCANLIPRAIANHRWYRQRFPDYPTGRKILLPFIW